MAMALISSAKPAFPKALKPLFDNAKLIDLPSIFFAYLRSGLLSKTSTCIPSLASNTAKRLPTRPAPTTATFLSFILFFLGLASFILISFSSFLNKCYQNKRFVFVLLFFYAEKLPSTATRQFQQLTRQKLGQGVPCTQHHCLILLKIDRKSVV